MLLAPAALELSDQIQTLGAYAGFAAIVGLAVLSLLYFGQARELRRLREWAGRAPERAAELQERVEAEASAAASAQKRVVAQPVRATPGAQPSTAAGAAATPAPPAPAVPAVPAANPGAPGALTVPAAATAAGAATSGTPATPATPGVPPVPGVPTPATGAGTDQPTVVVPGTTPLSGAAAGGTPISGVAPKAPTSPPPTGGGTGELTLPPSIPPAPSGSTQDSGETAVPLRRVSAASASPATVRAGAAGASTPPKDPAGRGGPLAIVGGLIAVLLVGILVATQLLGGDDGPAPPANTIATTPADAAPDDSEDRPKETTNTSTTPEVSRGSITVAVLNGTLTTGLAKGASDKVAEAGYRIGKITNANDQSRTATTVQFAEGSRRAAEDVAELIGVPVSAVSALDPGTRVVAGEDAVVVVTVGADQAQ